MSEQVEKLISSLKETANLFEEVSIVEKTVEKNEAEVLEQIIARLQPVLRFIDTKLIAEWESRSFSGGTFDQTTKHTEDSYILLHDATQRRHEDKNRWAEEGYQYFLRRDGKLVKFDSYEYTSQWQGETCESWLRYEEEITPVELFEVMTFNEVLYQIKRKFDVAVEENEKKLPILKKRIEQLDIVKQMLK